MENKKKILEDEKLEAVTGGADSLNIAGETTARWRSLNGNLTPGTVNDLPSDIVPPTPIDYSPSKKK